MPEPENLQLPEISEDSLRTQHPKRQYHRPTLSRIGTLQDLTRGAPGKPGDDGFDGGIS